MKGLVIGFLLFAASIAFAQAPDPQDSVIIESKITSPGAHPGSSSDTAAYVYVRVYITNKDTLANFTLPVEIRSQAGGAFMVLGYPRTFNGTASRLTSTLGNNLTFSSFANSASPDSAVWAGFSDPGDIATAEPPNAIRKAFWDIKFDSVKANQGWARIDSAFIFDNRVQFVTLDGQTANVNFFRGIVTVGEPCQSNCPAAPFFVPYGRPLNYNFSCEGTAFKWAVVAGPGSIDSATGLYSFSGQCETGDVPATVRATDEFGESFFCQFVIRVFDSRPSSAPAQNTVSVSHGQAAANQINASDPDAGDGFVFSKLSGPGTVNSSGGWSYPTSCADVGASPQTIRIKTSDAFDSCNPGPLSDTCEFQLVVTNAAPTFTNCPTDVLPADTGMAFSLQLSGADADFADAGSLQFSLVSGPAGFSVSSSGLAQWTPSGSQQGLKSAVVLVKDLCGASANCPINFAVSIRRGDLNADGNLTAADFVAILNAVFLGEPPRAGMWACDFNCDGHLSPADAIVLLNVVFLGAAFPC